MGGERFEGLLGEQDGAVAVGFEVDADVEFGGRVVEVLDAGGRADDGEFEVLGYVVCAGAVCVCGLDDANFDFVGHVGVSCQIAYKQRGE